MTTTTTTTTAHPLLIVGDNPAGTSGLGRLHRELAQRIHAHLGDQFEVASLTVGPGERSAALPWPQFSSPRIDNSDPTVGIIIPELTDVIRLFAGRERVTLLYLGNAIWTRWLANPSLLAPEFADLRRMLTSGLGGTRPFNLWGHFPVDSTGPGGVLSRQETSTIACFDRAAAYTAWGGQVIDRSLATHLGVVNSTPWLALGTDTAVWRPRDRAEARRTFISRVTRGQHGWAVSDDTLLLNIVATNSARKDWPLGIETASILRARGHKVMLWMHADRTVGAWNLPQLAEQFGVDDCSLVTLSRLSDEEMAGALSACDVSLGVASGGGWEYAMSESLACNCPVITGNYAGVTQFVPPFMRVEPVAWRVDGAWGTRRPVFDAGEWVERIEHLLKSPRAGELAKSMGRKSLLPERYSWDECWPAWEAWLRGGLTI